MNSLKNQYIPQGVCSRGIHFEVIDGLLHNVTFVAGCDGNLKAIGRLVEGMTVAEAIKRLKGIRCENNPTSCADQFAQALECYQEENSNQNK